MKIPYLLFSAFLFLASNVTQADWFLRGTHNNWGATQMVAGGTNTVQVVNVVFTAAGSIKFDRFGDWKESYGVGGLNGSNIPVAAGTWTIKFYTDTKNWSLVKASSSVAISSSRASSSLSSSLKSSSVQASSVQSSSAISSVSGTQYHLRGTHNGWVEGDLFSDVPGSTTDLIICRNFLAATGGARFKVDPNGGWGADSFPAADMPANGWTRIIISRNPKGIKTVATKLAENCGVAASSSSSLSASSVFVSSSISSSVASSSLLSSSVVSSSIQASSSSSLISSSSPHSSSQSSLISSSAKSSSSAIALDDFRARTTYFLFVDRFANGDTSNDKGNNPLTATTARASGGLSDWMKYFGGDIAGLISKLDYLQSLGITAIWVTPLVDNIDALGAAQNGAYHGYSGRDFYSVDEHLGDWALVDELNAQMEARGMKLILDIALNHSNPMDSAEFGTLLKEGAFITDFAGGKNTWYHNNGAITDCGDQNPNTTCADEWNTTWNVRNKTLYTLADFIQGTNQNSVADNYLIGAALKWMDHGVDGFRIDAIKHIEPSFISRFSAAVRAKKPDAYIFGEWYGAGANNTASMTFLNERRGSELLDFNLRDNIERTIAGGQTMTDLHNHIASRPAKMNNNEDLQSIFLDNHDSTRTSVYLQSTGNTTGGQGKGMSKAFAEARQNLGMALVMTLPGIPTIYYGSEQNTTWFTSNAKGFVGDDPYNREPMPSFSQTSPAFKMISALASLRQQSPAIQRGTYSQRWVNSDVLVFQRQEGADCAVIAINRGAQTSIDVNNLCLASGVYTSWVGSDIVSVSAGSATRFNLSQNEVVVLH
ncbi:MAG TPA: alpha-amylase family glycosyl hydrolase [Cellvibrio sp.]|nr:alpha-amylase family glycosyl hydrolase [Cellvibrio sp.]